MTALTAMAFPGMGPTEFTDVAPFMLVNRFARDLLGEAGDVLGCDLFERLRDSSSDYSEAAQVVFLVNCLALAQWAEHEWGLDPAFCTGASFGAKAAAVHAGALGFADGVRLTADLVRVESEYFAGEHGDVVTQSFARTPPDRLAEILAELTDDGEWCEISCVVDEDFAMVSLRRSRLDWLLKRLRAAGGLPLYAMDPPMHASIFAPLRDRVRDELFPALTFTDPVIPVIADQDGTVRTTAAEVSQMLLDGFVMPVRWPAVVDGLASAGVTQLCMAGSDALFSRVPVATRTFDVVAANPRAALSPYRRPALSVSGLSTTRSAA